jgi:hypothetical protein
MVEDREASPSVTPGLPKGSGSKAPWIILALLAAGALAVVISAGVAIIILRG